MKEVKYKFLVEKSHVKMLLQLEGGIYQTNLPVYLSKWRWDEKTQLPRENTPGYDKKVYMIREREKGLLYALERLKKYQLSPTCVNVAITWGKAVEIANMEYRGRTLD